MHRPFNGTTVSGFVVTSRGIGRISNLHAMRSGIGGGTRSSCNSGSGFSGRGGDGRPTFIVVL